MKNKYGTGIFVLLMILALLITGMVPAFAETDAAATDVAADEPVKISMDFRNADIRDVLSVLALNLDSNIIFTAPAVEISYSVKDILPLTALDYLLKSIGLEYVKNGNTIIVGTRESLKKDFFNQMAITRFSLKYVPADTISSQIDALAVPVQKITLPTNQKAIWIQGLPQDLGKIRELISLMDRAENGSDISNTPNIKLTPIQLKYITAEQMNEMIVSVGMQPGLFLDSNPKTLYVYASNSDLNIINDMKGKLDTSSNQQGSGRVIVFKKLNYIKSSALEPVLQQFASNVDIITSERTSQSIWMMGEESDIKMLSTIIDSLDVRVNIDDNLFFIYKLANITALDAVTRLTMLGIPEIKAYTFGYPQFSKSIMVVCPQDYKMIVTSQLNQMDTVTERIKVPIDFSQESGGSSRLMARRDLLVTLTGIPVANFTISSNVARGQPDDQGYLYVLVLEDTPEKIKMVEDMIAKLDKATVNEYEPEYSSVID